MISEDDARRLLPSSQKRFDEHTELQLLVMCLFGEARGQPDKTREGIGHVIINRVLRPNWWGNNLKEVILKPYQFSCMIGPEVVPASKQTDVNYRKLRDPLKYESLDVWVRCCDTAVRVFGRLDRTAAVKPLDIVRGSNHYYDTSISPPKWASEDRFILKMPSGKAEHWVRFYKL